MVSSGNGLFAAQNMMYRHTVTIYDANGHRKAKIRDEVNLREFGFSEYPSGDFKGGPVEAAFTKDGKYLWVSNYSMVGEGFEHPGCDACHGSEFDPGFLYKIDMSDYSIENVVKVGAVPKFLAISDDQKKLVVSNWSSGDVSIVDLDQEKEVKRVKVGAHPRGVDITADSKKAFVTVMGSTKIAEIDLDSYDLKYIKDVGRSPRSLILADHDSTMYVSLNSGSKVLKYNRYTGSKNYCKTAAGPRSMCITPEEDFIYVVNYFDHSFSKIATHEMKVVEKVKTSEKPIGICGNWETSEIWVACYSGRIEIFKDFQRDSIRHGTSIMGFDLSSFWAFNHRSDSKEDLAKIELDYEETQEAVEGVQEEVIVVETSSFILPKTPIDILIADRFPKENMIENEKENEEPTATDPLLEVEVMDEDLSVARLDVNDSKIAPKSTIDIVQKDRFPKMIEPSGECKYHVIAGSFSDPNNAENRKNELISKGYTAVIIHGSLNYVSAICYEDRGSAEIGASQVKSNTGYSAWILKR